MGSASADFGLGSLQVLGATALMTAVIMLFGASWQVAFIGATGFVLTSTAIVMSSLGENNELGTAKGQSMVSILLFEDLLIVPLLAIVAFLSPVVHASETLLGSRFWWRLVHCWHCFLLVVC